MSELRYSWFILEFTYRSARKSSREVVSLGEGAFLSDNLLSTCTTAAYVDAVSLFYNFFHRGHLLC